MKCFKLKLIHICIQPHIHDSACVLEYKRKCVSRNLKQRKLQGATPIYWDHIGNLCVSGVTASHYNIILTMKCNNTCQNPLIIALNLGSMGLLVPNIGGLRRYIQISKYSDIQIFKHSKRSFTFSRPWGREWPRSRQIEDLAILSAPKIETMCSPVFNRAGP